MTTSPTTLEPTDEGIVLRIVVHGAPYAGKTTTAHTLGVRLGQEVVTPSEDENGRTLLFDWMEYVGGRFDGRPIQTQLVTVPGHDPERSTRLLREADVVLFVVDTRAEGIDDSVALFEEVQRQIATLPDPVGLVVQANKRDEPSALPMDEVLPRLALDDDVVVIETIASDGEGVRQAFVYAVRVGLRHRSTRTGDAVRATSPDALVAELLATEPAPAPEADAAPDVECDVAPDLADTTTTVEPEPEPEPEQVRHSFADELDDMRERLQRARHVAAEPPIVEPTPAPTPTPARTPTTAPERPEPWKPEPRELPRPRWRWLRRD